MRRRCETRSGCNNMNEGVGEEEEKGGKGETRTNVADQRRASRSGESTSAGKDAEERSRRKMP